jgi:trk system potassium uptake protein TrkA
VGRTVTELLDCGECIAVAVTRAGRSMLPSAEMPLQAGDAVHVSATPEGMSRLRKRIATEKG